MRSKLTRAISLFLLFVLALNLFGCSVFDRAGDKVANDILSDATSKVTATSYDPNGSSIFEETRIEKKLEEKTLLEIQIEQKLLSELMLEPAIKQEGVKLESIRVEVIESKDLQYDDLACNSYFTTQLDYSIIHDKLSDGLSLVIAEVVIDAGSLIINLVCANWRSALVDAGQIVLTVGATSLSAFIAYHVTKAKSLAAGNSYEVAVYDAWDSASTAFYYASVIVDVVNTVISLAQIVKAIVDVSKKLPIILSRIHKIITNADKTVTVTKTTKNTYEVIQDGKKIICKLAADSGDLYNPVTGKYICSLVADNSDLVKVVNKEIPSIINNKNGELIYRVDKETHELFKIIKDSEGVAKEISKGIVDEGGFIYSAGKIVSRIDFSTGKVFDSAYNAINALGLSTNVFGEILDSTNKVVSVKRVGGVLSLLDENKKVLAKVYEGKDGLKWLQRVDNGRTIGRISEEGLFEFSWKTELDAARRTATQTVREKLVEFIKSGKYSDSQIRRIFPDLTLEHIDYIRTYGKVPQDIQIHHCYNVANFPDMAGDIRNLEVLSQESHLAQHGGDFRRATSSRSPNWVDLTEVFNMAA